MSDPSTYGIEALFRLQDIEGRIRDLESMNDRSEEGERVAKCHQALQRSVEHTRVVKERLQQTEKKLRRLELDLASLESDIDKHEQQMFDGTVKDARGLSNIQERVVADRRRKDQLEEEALEVMEQIEDLNERLTKLDAETQRIDRAYASAKKQMVEAQAKWREQVAALSTERTGLIDRIAPGLLNTYQSLATKVARPVARVAEKTCRGCNVTLPTSLKRPDPDEILRCPHCGRLLWWPT